MTAHNASLIGGCKNLVELCETINSAESAFLDAVDFSDLPTFGGETPADTTDVYSWDQNSLMVSMDGGSKMKVISR